MAHQAAAAVVVEVVVAVVVEVVEVEGRVGVDRRGLDLALKARKQGVESPPYGHTHVVLVQQGVVAVAVGSVRRAAV